MRWKCGIDNLQLQWDKAQTDDLQREKVQTCKPIRYKLTTLKGNRQTIDSLTSKMKTDNLSLHHIRSILVFFEKGANRQHTNSKRLGKNDKL